MQNAVAMVQMQIEMLLVAEDDFVSSNLHWRGTDKVENIFH